MIRRLSPTFVGVFFVFLIPIFAGAQTKQSSPAEALGKVVSVLISQANDLKKSLLSLRDLSDEEGELRFRYLQFLEGLSDYYQSLKIADDGTNVRDLALGIKEKREESSSQLKAIGDFILVFQAKGVLNTAQNRLVKINTDLERLEDLKIIEKGKPEFLLNQALLSLTGAGEAIGKAEELLAITTEARSEIRNLVGVGISKIKTAYKKFLEISSLLKEALR